MTYLPVLPCFRIVRGFLCHFLVLMGAILCFSVSAIAQMERQEFDIPAGTAAESLKQIARQAEVDILFDTSAVEGIMTPALEGRFSAREALDRLLFGTPLFVLQDEETLSFAISRELEDVPEVPVEMRPTQPTTKPKTESDMPQTNNRDQSRNWFSRLMTGLSVVLISSASVNAQEDEDDVYELSPFTVQTAEDTYQATSTLAGTRLNTDVADVGASISIVTKQFMDDIAATDASTILPYTANTEVGGILGNFSAASASANSGYDDNESRVNPQNAQRVRGLVPAELTRNYYRTSIPLDAYNTSSVTINRGPNSVLFGLGSPGGIIENSVNRPVLGQDFTELSNRISNYGSHRTVLDFNKTLWNGKLGIRVNLLNSNESYKQEEAWENDQRAFFAMDLLLSEGGGGFLGSSRLKANFEGGSIEANPPSITPPAITYAQWWTPPNAAELIAKHGSVETLSDINRNVRVQVDGDDGRYRSQHIMRNAGGLDFGTFVTVPGFRRIAQVHPNNDGRTDIFGKSAWHPSGFYAAPINTMHWRVTNNYNQLAGFINPSLMNRNTFDYHNHLFTGDTNRIEHDFDVQEFAFEQLMLDGNLGFELGYNEQNYDRFSFTPWAGGASRRLWIEVGQFSSVPKDLNNQDGTADEVLNTSPNLGRPGMFNGAYTQNFNEVNTDTFRATAFFRHDFADSIGDFGKWLGRHTITGLFEDYSETTPSKGVVMKVDSNEIDAHGPGALRNDFRSGNTNAVSAVYLGPSALNLSGPDELVVDLPIRVPIPEVGQPFSAYYFDQSVRQTKEANFYHTWANVNQNINRREVSSEAFVVQSNWLQEHLSTIFAWRDDSVKSFEMIPEGLARLDDGSRDPDKRVLSDTAASDISGDTFTQSYVLKMPFKLPGDSELRVHYFESETFEPASIGRNIRGEIVSNPTGNTEEYGFSIDLMDRRLSLRVNWYETASSNARTDANGAIGNVNFWFGESANNGHIARILATEQSGLDVTDPDWTVNKTDPNGISFTPAELGFTSYDQIYDAFLSSIPEPTRSLWNHQIDRTTGFVEATPIEGLTATFDFVSEGTEVELIGAITDNWNVALNVAQQETVQANTAPVLKAWIDEIQENYKANRLEFGGNPTANQGRSPFSFNNTTSVFNVNAAVAKNGVQSHEQREWRWNLVSTYRFNEGRLRGVTFGGALRWQDKAAIGNPIIKNSDGVVVADIFNPYFGDDELNADAWVGYRRMLFDDKVDWKIQLNVRNLIRESNDIPISIDPLGHVNGIRIPLERQFLLTNTFKF